MNNGMQINLTIWMKMDNFLKNCGLKCSANSLTLPLKCGAQFPSP